MENHCSEIIKTNVRLLTQIEQFLVTIATVALKCLDDSL